MYQPDKDLYPLVDLRALEQQHQATPRFRKRMDIQDAIQQEVFLDLCDLFVEPTPKRADERYETEHDFLQDVYGR